MTGPAVKDLKGACTDLQCVFNDADILFSFVGNQEGPLWVRILLSPSKNQGMEGL